MNWNPFRRAKQLTFADDHEMKKLEQYAEEFYENVLEDGDEPSFVSDEASVFDFSSSEPQVLVLRCNTYYGTSIAIRDLHLPFHQLLRRLVKDRGTRSEDSLG